MFSRDVRAEHAHRNRYYWIEWQKGFHLLFQDLEEGRESRVCVVIRFFDMRKCAIYCGERLF